MTGDPFGSRDAVTSERQDPLTRRRRPDRWLLLGLLVVVLVRGALYAAILPPWLPYDEHGHFEYAWLASQYGPFVGPEAISTEFQQRVLQSMYEHEYWAWCHQPMPEALPQGFTDPNEPWLRYSRAQVGDEPPLYYGLLGAIFSLLPSTPLLTLLYIGRAFSVLLYAAAVALIYMTGRRVFPESRFMTLMPAAFVAFLPMMGQMGAAVNSDALSVLAASAVYYVWAHVFAEAKLRRYLPAMGVCLILALLAKKTTVFLLLTLPFGWIIWLLTFGFISAKVLRQVALILAGAAIIVLGGLAVLPSQDAAGWYQWRLVEGPSCGPARVNGIAHSGSAALRIGACRERHLTQGLSEATLDAAAGSVVHVQGWARSEHGEARARVYVLDTGGESGQELELTETWQPFQFSYAVGDRPRYMVVRAAWLETGSAVLLDDVQLTVGEDTGNRLVNGSAEEAKSTLLMVMVRCLRLMRVPDRIAEQLFARESWQRTALAAHFLAFRFAFESFWGFFGSMSLALPRVWYRLILLGCGVTVLSLFVSLFVRSRRATRRQTGYMILACAGVLLLFAQTFVPILGMRASDWLPQGRYLFPGLLPMALLGAWAWYWWLPVSWERWAIGVSAGALALFDVGCLWMLMLHFIQ